MISFMEGGLQVPAKRLEVFLSLQKGFRGCSAKHKGPLEWVGLLMSFPFDTKNRYLFQCSIRLHVIQPKSHPLKPTLNG